MFKNIIPEKKLMIALCLSYIGILPSSLFFNYNSLFYPFKYFFLTISFYLIGIVASVIGIIFGIQGLKSTEKLFARVSIILVIVNLLLLLLSLYFYLAILADMCRGTNNRWPECRQFFTINRQLSV